MTEQHGVDNFRLDSFGYRWFATETIKWVIVRFPFRNKLLWVCCLIDGLEIFNLKLIDCVSDLTLIAHAVRIRSIDVSTVNHPRVNMFFILLSIVQSRVLKHFGLFEEVFNNRIVVFGQTIACLIKPEVWRLVRFVRWWVVVVSIMLNCELLKCAWFSFHALVPSVMIFALVQILAIH